MNMALLAVLLENRLYGPVNTLLAAIFWNPNRWMIKPQVALRDTVGYEWESEDESDSESAAEDRSGQSDMFHLGNIDTSYDSQRNPVQPDRRRAKKPDFAVSKSTEGLHSDVHHLYIEIKNGQSLPNHFMDQMENYLRLIIKLIPEHMEDDVIVLLINGTTTSVWNLRRDTVLPELIFSVARDIPTNGPEMMALLQQIAAR